MLKKYLLLKRKPNLTFNHDKLEIKRQTMFLCMFFWVFWKDNTEYIIYNIHLIDKKFFWTDFFYNVCLALGKLHWKRFTFKRMFVCEREQRQNPLIKNNWVGNNFYVDWVTVFKMYFKQNVKNLKLKRGLIGWNFYLNETVAA